MAAFRSVAGVTRYLGQYADPCYTGSSGVAQFNREQLVGWLRDLGKDDGFIIGYFGRFGIPTDVIAESQA